MKQWQGFIWKKKKLVFYLNILVTEKIQGHLEATKTKEVIEELVSKAKLIIPLKLPLFSLVKLLAKTQPI